MKRNRIPKWFSTPLADDDRTQPAGAPGETIACGIFRPIPGRWMRRFPAALPVLVILGTAGMGTSDAPTKATFPQEEHKESTRGAAPDTGRRSNLPQASRQETRKGLETRYSGLALVLDSLGRDSAAVKGGMREQYRRNLHEARTAKDKTRVHLEELRVSEPGVTPEIWEEIRARAELSLDSLRRLILSADSTHKLHSGRPGPGSE